MKKFNSKKSGFTLIELIVVIAIIGILIAITVPRLSTYIQAAQVTAEQAGAKTVYSATVAFNTAVGDGSGGIKTGPFKDTDLAEFLDDNAKIVDTPAGRGQYSVTVTASGDYYVGYWDVSADDGKGAVSYMLNGAFTTSTPPSAS